MVVREGFLASESEAVQLANRILGEFDFTPAASSPTSCIELLLNLRKQYETNVAAEPYLGSLLMLRIVDNDGSSGARLELLVHLVIALQNKRRGSRSSAETNSASVTAETTIEKRDTVPEMNENNEFPVTTLPSHFTAEQRDMVRTCYQHLHADHHGHAACDNGGKFYRLISRTRRKRRRYRSTLTLRTRVVLEDGLGEAMTSVLNS
jgi:hypothetical protein